MRPRQAAESPLPRSFRACHTTTQLKPLLNILPRLIYSYLIESLRSPSREKVLCSVFNSLATVYSGLTVNWEQVVTTSTVRLHCQCGPSIGSTTPRGVPIATVVPVAPTRMAVRASIRELVQLNCMALPSSEARTLSLGITAPCELHHTTSSMLITTACKGIPRTNRQVPDFPANSISLLARTMVEGGWLVRHEERYGASLRPDDATSCEIDTGV